MTTETGPAQSAARPAATADSRRAKGHPNGVGTAGPGAMVGFMAILASLDASQTVDSTNAIAVDAQLPSQNAMASTCVAQPSVHAGVEKAFEQRGERIGGDMKSLAVQDPDESMETDTLQQLQLGLAGTASAMSWALNDLQSPGAPPQAASLLLVQTSVLPVMPTTNAQPGNQDLSAELVASVAGGAKPPDSVGTLGATTVQSEFATDLALEPTGKVGKSQKDATARLASISDAVATHLAPVGRDYARNVLAAAKLADFPSAPVAPTVAMTTTAGLGRRDEPQQERSIFRTHLNESTPISPPYSSMPAHALAPGAQDPLVPTEMYVAEKVAYWISHDVQSAEMKLDGIGAEPVEVSIRMQGNEAHIAFRTDELQARASLENASAQLKDLLQREGLVLSGVSVGTSGSGGPGEQERRPRPSGRQSTVAASATVQPVKVGASAVLHRIAGGSLDLFV